MTKKSRTAEDAADVRIDKWLWAARFFKTRALASEAVNGGKVHLNGARCKPAKSLQFGDELVIQKGPYAFHISVQGLSGRRGPASEAVKLYTETPESVRTRESLQEQNRMLAASAPHPEHRPDKKQRRQLIKVNRNR